MEGASTCINYYIWKELLHVCMYVCIVLYCLRMYVCLFNVLASVQWCQGAEVGEPSWKSNWTIDTNRSGLS